MFLILEEDFPDRLTTEGLLRHLRTRDMDPARALGAEVRHDFEENQPGAISDSEGTVTNLA